MTLDIGKFITNIIKTQAKIQHLDVKAKTAKTDSIPDSVSKLIISQYGDTYLLDANYVAFFWGNLKKEDIKRLFNIVNKALGESANRLTETDFKKIDMEENSDDVDDNDSADEQEPDVEDETEEIIDDGNDEEEIDDIDVEQLNEDDESEAPMQHLFLKITLK